jgi:hypothetical protein
MGVSSVLTNFCRMVTDAHKSTTLASMLTACKNKVNNNGIIILLKKSGFLLFYFVKLTK